MCTNLQYLVLAIFWMLILPTFNLPGESSGWSSWSAERCWTDDKTRLGLGLCLPGQNLPVVSPAAVLVCVVYPRQATTTIWYSAASPCQGRPPGKECGASRTKAQAGPAGTISKLWWAIDDTHLFSFFNPFFIFHFPPHTAQRICQAAHWDGQDVLSCRLRLRCDTANRDSGSGGGGGLGSVLHAGRCRGSRGGPAAGRGQEERQETPFLHRPQHDAQVLPGRQQPALHGDQCSCPHQLQRPAGSCQDRGPDPSLLQRPGPGEVGWRWVLGTFGGWCFVASPLPK